MEERGLLWAAQAYYKVFGIWIPNEPGWLIPEGETEESFTALLESSVKDGTDYVSQKHGKNWYKQRKDRIY